MIESANNDLGDVTQKTAKISILERAPAVTAEKLETSLRHTTRWKWKLSQQRKWQPPDKATFCEF
jgi:hypothetical protein